LAISGQPPPSPSRSEKPASKRSRLLLGPLQTVSSLLTSPLQNPLVLPALRIRPPCQTAVFQVWLSLKKHPADPLAGRDNAIISSPGDTSDGAPSPIDSGHDWATVALLDHAEDHSGPSGQDRPPAFSAFSRRTDSVTLPETRICMYCFSAKRGHYLPSLIAVQQDLPPSDSRNIFSRLNSLHGM
jgi:hypothetical protein